LYIQWFRDNEMVGYVLVFEGDNVSAEDRNTRFNKFFIYKNTNNEEDMLYVKNESHVLSGLRSNKPYQELL